MTDLEQVRAYYRAILPYYDASLEDRGDLSFWASIAQRWGAKRILELGCGTGRVTEVLSQFAPVIAVDLLMEMLHVAQRKAPTASLVNADLRNLAFRSTFDLIILADDPMAHLTSTEERIKVIRLIAEHLMPEGRVVMEGLYRQPGKSATVETRNIVREGQTLFTVEEFWEPASHDSLWNATYRYTKGGSISEATSLLRSWTPAEVTHLSDSGLQVETVWGDFDESPFSDNSPRMVIVARKGEKSASWKAAG